MKYLILLIFVLSTFLTAQDWDNPVTTNLGPVNVKMFTNSSGHHLLLQYPGAIYYSKMSSEGITQGTPVLLANSGSYHSISGRDSKLFFTYIMDDYIKGKYSTNDGGNWNNLPDIYAGQGYCYGIESIADHNGMHLVYSIDNEVYYYRLTSSYSWVDFQNVTNQTSAEYGKFPSITLSSNRIHVGFNNSFSEQIVDKYNGVWQTPQTIVSYPEQSDHGKLFVSGNQIYLFYSKIINPDFRDLHYRTCSVGGSNWSVSNQIGTGIIIGATAFNIAKTTNSLHVIYQNYHSGDRENSTYYLKYRNYNGFNWNNELILADNVNPSSEVGLTTVTNDIHILWLSQFDNLLHYIKSNSNPATPQDLSLSEGENGHPYLEWARNPDPDIKEYQLYRSYGGWSNIAPANFTDISFTDEGVIINPGPEAGTEVYYKVKAVDKGNLESGFSNLVSCNVPGKDIEKKGSIGSDVISDYQLSQNYPNPFNPSTVISYQLPKAGLVQLKVYNLLGKEVAQLVNEYKSEGKYDVNFNASGLSSGLYLYSLKVNDFVTYQKMTLLK